jgi:hypothetical protein
MGSPWSTSRATLGHLHAEQPRQRVLCRQHRVIDPRRRRRNQLHALQHPRRPSVSHPLISFWVVTNSTALSGSIKCGSVQPCLLLSPCRPAHCIVRCVLRSLHIRCLLAPAAVSAAAGRWAAVLGARPPRRPGGAAAARMRTPARATLQRRKSSVRQGVAPVGQLLAAWQPH